MLEGISDSHRRWQVLRRLTRNVPFWSGAALMGLLLMLLTSGVYWAASYYFGYDLNFIALFLFVYALWFSRRIIVPWVKKLFGRMSLLPAVLLATAGGAAIAWVAWWALAKLLRPTGKQPDPIDITKLSLTIAGGIGAVVALVVAYRRQRDIEQGRFVERFGAAAAQLGASQVAVRLAGVYAMAGVADESSGLQRQQCIDVLCGYLRLPYAPERGSNYQTQRIRKGPGSDADAAEIEDHFEYMQNDREVRGTIVRVIADRLRGAVSSWSGSDFDFRTAYLEDPDFSLAVFKGEARFDDATFTGEARFVGVSFSGSVSFDRATFEGGAHFNQAIFSYSSFESARFLGCAVFWNAMFDQDVDFSGSVFNEVEFMRAHFAGSVSYFIGSIFESDVVFSMSFYGAVNFRDAEFRGQATFGLQLYSEAYFMSTDFGSGVINFQSTKLGRRCRPLFDWDSDPSNKPPNIKPADWSTFGR